MKNKGFVRLCLFACAPCLITANDTAAAAACGAVMLISGTAAALMMKKCENTLFSCTAGFTAAVCASVGGSMAVGAVFDAYLPPQPSFALAGAPAVFAFFFAVSGRKRRPVRLAVTAVGCALTVVLTGTVRELLTGKLLGRSLTQYGLPEAGSNGFGAATALCVILLMCLLTGRTRKKECSRR